MTANSILGPEVALWKEEDEDAVVGVGVVAAAVAAAAGAVPSSTDGSSGTGPCFAHLLVSYLLLMKLSTL